VVSLLCVFLAWSAADERPEQPSTSQLVRRLESKKFAEREEATRLPLQGERGADLRAAVKSAAPQTARRLGLVPEQVGEREGKRALKRLPGLAEQGEVDQVVVVLARWPRGRDTATLWHAATTLARKVMDHHRKQGGAPKDVVSVKLTAAPGREIVADRLTLPRVAFDRRPAFVRAEEAELGFGQTLVAASGPFRGDVLSYSVVLASGSVTLGGVIGSLIICDGDVTFQSGQGCLIIARGTVKCASSMSECRVVAGKSVILVRKEKAEVLDCTIEENVARPLGFVQFFDPAREGIVVESAASGVRVKAAEEGKPFAKAGLRVGDLITAVDGDAADSPETFRRLLRRGWVYAEGLTLRVQRGDNALDHRVATPR
jgi:hypothetical protein